MTSIGINSSLKQLANYHRNNKNFLSFCTIGSYVRKEIIKIGDVDCLIITKTKLSDQYFFSLISLLSDRKFLYGGKSDDTFILNKNRINFSLAYFYKKDFNDYVQKLIDGKILIVEQRPWVIGGRIPEIFLGDIKSASILFDVQNDLTSYKQYFQKQYPPKLQKLLIVHLKKEIINKLALIELCLKNKNYFLFDVGLREIIISIIRYLYARSNLFLLPIKHIVRGLNDKNLPSKCRAIIEQLLVLNTRANALRKVKHIISKLNLNNNKNVYEEF